MQEEIRFIQESTLLFRKRRVKTVSYTHLHPGPESISAFFGVAPVASSSYPNSMGQMTRELAKEELPGIVAVSYTHLDVYKRQV